MSTQAMVVGFAFHAGQVLLIRKAKPEWQAGRLNGVGGKVEANELELSAMQREFHEKAGLAVHPWWRWRRFCVLDAADRSWRVFFFVAHLSDHEARAVRSQTEEHLEWHPVEQLPRDTIDNLRWLIPMALARSPVWAQVVEERRGGGAMKPMERDFAAGINAMARLAKEMPPPAHHLKTWPESFVPLKIGTKTFEVRENDRDFQVGDVLVLREWDPDTQMLTGRVEMRRVLFILQGKFGLPDDVCVMSLGEYWDMMGGAAWMSTQFRGVENSSAVTAHRVAPASEISSSED